jgi:hypothetical protein
MHMQPEISEMKNGCPSEKENSCEEILVYRGTLGRHCRVVIVTMRPGNKNNRPHSI